MPVRRVIAQDKVIADRDRVALQRGPIVYAAEWPDNPNGKVRNIVLPGRRRADRRVPSRPAQRRQVIRGRAIGLAAERRWHVRKAEQPFMAIPYSTWANRGRGQMAVWLARIDTAARPTPYPTIATTSTIAASPLPNGRGKNPRNIDRRRGAGEFVGFVRLLRLVAGGAGMRSIEDADAGMQQGEWIEMTFAKPSTVSRERRSTGSTTPAAAACACRRRGDCSIKRRQRVAAGGTPAARSASRAIAGTTSRSRR